MNPNLTQPTPQIQPQPQPQPQVQSQATSSPQPDLQALALVKAIRTQESGGNYNAVGDAGTSNGAFQFQSGTWKQFAGQILGDPNAQMTTENQNAVAYGMVKTWKDAGMGPAEIAAAWNAGHSRAVDGSWVNNVGTTTINGKQIAYNTPKYVQSVVSNFKQIYPQVQQQFGAPQANAQMSQTQPQDQGGPSVSGFLGNVASSAGNLIGGLGNAIMHPVQTVQNLVGTVAGGAENASNKILGTQFNNADTEMANNLGQYFTQRYGGDSLQHVLGSIGHTLYTDPVGAALDVSTLLDGVGGALGAASKVSKISELSDVANTVKSAASMINPVSKVANITGKTAGMVANGTGSILKSAISHSTGFNTDTISNIVKDPASFTKVAIEETSRGGVLNDVTTGLNNLENHYNTQTGPLYTAFEKSKQIVSLPENFLEDILNKGTVTEDGRSINFGYKLEPVESVPKVPSATDVIKGALTGKEDLPSIQMDAPKQTGWKVVADTNSKFYDPSSVSAVQKFVDRWGDKTEMTPKEFLNMRTEAAKLGRLGREIGENKSASLIGRAIRGQLNKTVRPQIKGLQTADEVSGPEIKLISNVKKDLYTADGELRDRAASKVALALNKEGLLSRLEKISPGITAKLETLRSVEDIERSMGIKVGAYARSAGEIFGAATGNVPMIVGMILTHPKIAMQILRGFGYTAKTSIPILGRVRALLGALPKEALQTSLQAGIINNQANQTPQ